MGFSRGHVSQSELNHIFIVPDRTTDKGREIYVPYVVRSNFQPALTSFVGTRVSESLLNMFTKKFGERVVDSSLLGVECVACTST